MKNWVVAHWLSGLRIIHTDIYIPTGKRKLQNRDINMAGNGYALYFNKRGTYLELLLSGQLKNHLLMIQERAEERFDMLVEQMAKQEGVSEKLKVRGQILWV